jgi:putative transposase
MTGGAFAPRNPRRCGPLVMQKLAPLEPEKYYHIYNRGVNRENVFFEERNYGYFLQLYAKYIEPVADTFAYCLMKNHFHLLVRIKSKETFEALARNLEGLSSSPAKKAEVVTSAPRILVPTQQFSNLFNAYAKAINKTYGRTGSLFEGRFGRIEVPCHNYFANLVAYIHRNPQKHGFVRDFREYPYSSYAGMLTDKRTRLRRDEVLKWFGGQSRFLSSHEIMTSQPIRQLVEDDNFDE